MSTTETFPEAAAGLPVEHLSPGLHYLNGEHLVEVLPYDGGVSWAFNSEMFSSAGVGDDMPQELTQAMIDEALSRLELEVQTRLDMAEILMDDAGMTFPEAVEKAAIEKGLMKPKRKRLIEYERFFPDIR